MRATHRGPSIVPTEEQEQMALFAWADTKLHWFPELRWMFAIHNGLRLSVGMRAKAKRLGTRKGVADVCLPVARGAHHGLYIEMKRQSGGVLSGEQKAFRDFVIAEGYCWRQARGWEEASTFILRYLGAIL